MLQQKVSVVWKFVIFDLHLYTKVGFSSIIVIIALPVIVFTCVFESIHPLLVALFCKFVLAFMSPYILNAIFYFSWPGLPCST